MSNGNMQCGDAPGKRVYRVDEIAELLHVSKGSVYSLIREGAFHTVRIGSAIRVSKKSFDEWLDSRKTST
ncbi:MAG: helix-turn-helix domain-containing protein [Christensenellales bacterium]